MNLAYRWFCKLGIEHKIPNHSGSRVPAMSGSATAASFAGYSSVWSRLVSQPAFREGALITISGTRQCHRCNRSAKATTST